MDGSRRQLAVLIDGDNATPNLMGAMMEEVGRYGNAAIRRIYGDWASGRLNGWTEGLHHHGAEARQQHNAVKGKNATDGALIIDAMDILYAGVVDGFCIVSSDSDYAALAKRLRASGKFVLGIGAKQTPMPFVRACDEFSYVENLTKSAEKAPKTPAKKAMAPDLLQKLTAAIRASEGENGHAHLAEVGAFLRQEDPGFDPRSWGYAAKQLSPLLRQHPELFDLRTEQNGTAYVKLKQV